MAITYPFDERGGRPLILDGAYGFDGSLTNGGTLVSFSTLLRGFAVTATPKANAATPTTIRVAATKAIPKTLIDNIHHPES